jgi:hypothetical protein
MIAKLYFETANIHLNTPMKKFSWKPVIVFYLLAVARKVLE